MNQKHSGLGIASFVTSIVSSVSLFLTFLVAGVLEVSTPGGLDEESAAAIVVGLCMFAFLFVALVSLGLGIGGLIQKDRTKLFAVLGTVFSACAFFGTIVLVLIGLAIE
jgi:hypothetical protein